jgi:hypothetical protein
MDQWRRQEYRYERMGRGTDDSSRRAGAIMSAIKQSADVVTYIRQLERFRDTALEILDPLARSVCLDQRTGDDCHCFACLARAALVQS